MYSREQIEQVRASVDIVDVIRTYVPSLTHSGKTVRGLCPFHNERTPSFHVQPEKGFFKCFGCGEAGDVITFLSKLEKVSFTEALEKLASQAGVVLKKERVTSEKRPDDTREKISRVLEAACAFYQEQLWHDTFGADARAYLSERGVHDDTIQHFQLGCAPTSGPVAFETLVKKGFSIDVCQQAGLVTRSASGRFYDPQFGRLIFPIFDTFGHVVGFGGRVLPKKKALGGLIGGDSENEGPKYLNSPETPVFSKGKLLYGLHQAKSEMLTSRRAMIMEGYMDVVGAHQAGFRMAVASLGTAFTRDHAKILKRYADEVVAFFDPDEAGAKAAIKSLEPLLQESLFPRVVMTDETGDPDEIILSRGNEFFSDLITKAPDFVDYFLAVSLRSTDLSLQKRSVVAGQILQLIAQSPNEILRAEWIDRVANKLGLRRESLENELRKKKADAHAAPATTVVRVEKTAPRASIPSAEEEYLQLLFTHGEGSGSALTENDFTTSRERVLYRLMKNMRESSSAVSLPRLNDEMPDGDREWLLSLFLEEKNFDDPAERREQLVRDIRLKRMKDRREYLGQQIKKGSSDADVLAEYSKLSKLTKGSKV